MITNQLIKDNVVALLTQETERDKQKKVGASQISDPCTKHLAYAINGGADGPQKYWLGGKIGTAIHSIIESNIADSDLPFFADSVVERKIILGDVPGYGVVSSKPDLVLPSSKLLLDWKSSTRAKTKKLQAFTDGVKHYADVEYTLMKYMAQTQLYAWGLNRDGYEIDTLGLVFINRDGTNENDIWPYTYPYDESIAVSLWNRFTALWSELEAGAHPEDYQGNPNCFKCAIGI